MTAFIICERAFIACCITMIYNTLKRLLRAPVLIGEKMLKNSIRKVKLYICALLALFLLPLFVSCEAEEAVAPANVAAFFDALDRQDYSYCYSVIDDAVKEDLTLTDFVSRYNAIYEAMGLVDVEYRVLSTIYSDETCVAEMQVIYRCEKLGDIEQTIAVSLSYENESSSWKVNWSPSMILSDLGDEDIVSVNALRQKRGEILDSQGNAFAVNGYAETIYMDIDKVGDYGSAARSLSALVDISEIDIVKKMTDERAQADGVAIITYYVPGTLDSELREKFLSIQGVGIDNSRYTPIRYYPQGSMMAHMIGYATVATKEDLDTMDGDIYGVDSYIGRSGLEAASEDVLAGRRGIELVIRTPQERDEQGVPVTYSRKSVVKRVDAVDGEDLCLTIDFVLQKRAEEQLAILEDHQAGSVVVLDPTTGAVLAIASNPTFDLNIFADRNVKELYETLLEDPKTPLYNRSTRGLYAPGSTVKPLVAAMALDSGLFSVNTEFKGTIYKRQWLPTVEGWVYPAITRVSNYEPPYNMANAIIHSDNIYFAQIALTTGWERMVNLYTALGFDVAVGFDTNIARPSIYNDSSWSNLRLLADMGYGQGELLITPLQMAGTFEIFVNDGKIMQPYIVAEHRATVDGRYVTTQKFEPATWREGILSSESVSAMNDILVQTMQRSSISRIEGILTAGKTGTAQVDANTEIAWLIAYVEEEAYERLVCVTLEMEPDANVSIRHDIGKALLMP